VEAGLKIAELLMLSAMVAAIIAYLLTFGLSHLYDVIIGREGLDVVLFRTIVMATIPYGSIEIAERRWIFLVIDAAALWSVALPIANRAGLRPVTIKLKRRIGIFRHIAITPEDPVRFLEQFHKHLRAAGYP